MFTMAIDPTKSPKTIDMVGVVKLGGIYDWDGPHLKIIGNLFVGNQKDKRPAEFKTMMGDGRLLLVVWRDTKEERTAVMKWKQALRLRNEPAKACLREIIKKYPQTLSGKKAKVLLKSLEEADRDAAAKLQVARKQAKDGLKDKANALCQEIIKQYPRSDSATEAKEFLAFLNREENAASKLNLAKMLAKDGLTKKARERLEEIVKLYPGTEAAKEAKKMLKGLSK
jgi:tetratricopeptide (TPR) repeat protein